eukprot:Lithocolla_globosa_v1_NODE_513_length_3859_cov_6.191115.p2 type:complete len:322 gc:universal NODE_513_length_3859_cov_6.191115:1771-2736(+)
MLVVLLTSFNNLITSKNTSFAHTLVQTLISAQVKKDGAANKLNDRRGITLFNSLAKCLEKIFHLRFMSSLMESMPDIQPAYQPNRSPVELLFIFHEANALETGPFFVCFLDLRKAFDALPRKGLFLKLWMMGIRGQTWTFFSAWYEGLLTSVRLNSNFRTRFFTLESGVLQGSLLGPLFFLIFVLDLLIDLINSGYGLDVLGRLLSVLALGDDIALLCRDAAGLHKLLKICENWARKWHLTFNEAKSGWQYYHPDGAVYPGPHRFSIMGQDLPIARRYRYIGLDTSPSSLHYDVALTGRANAARAASNRLLTALQQVHISV